MKKRWRRTGRVLVALLLAVCSLSVNLSPVLAVTQADIDALKDDAGDLSAQRKELEKKLDALADDKSSAMERKNLLDQQIANTSAQISNVEAQISKYASLISRKRAGAGGGGGAGGRPVRAVLSAGAGNGEAGHRVLLVCSLQRGELYGPALQGGFHQ